MSAFNRVIGLDIGSVSVTAAEVDEKRQVLRTTYLFHHGDVESACHTIFKQFDLKPTDGLAATSSTPELIQAHARYDNRVATIAAARKLYPEMGSILIVGGEKFGLILFDENGNYLKYKTNTSCAAGTGSFLDQQARRLNLSGIEELSRIAYGNRGEIPKIASRCAVFAKTDLVHAQQEGYSLEEITDGLCRGLAKNVVDTLFLGEKPGAPMVFTGGVAKNAAVVRHFEAMVDVDLLVDRNSALGAAGAAMLLLDGMGEMLHSGDLDMERVLVRKAAEKKSYHDPLELRLSDYPDFRGLKSYLFHPEDRLSAHVVEVDEYEDLSVNEHFDAYLGVDVGSTSTKAVVMGVDHTVLAGFYTRTAGRPVSAVQALLAAIDGAFGQGSGRLNVLGLSTTGSGRKLSGRVFGADTVLDEITAHARAAYELTPEVDTIIEIGGQDSKFTTLKNGMVTFSVMNNVCAAGTGSFIEELAQRLDCPLRDYADRAEGKAAPVTSDRCTVFMERDVNHYLREGYSVDETLASLLHSIRENYLTKVAIEHGIGDTVLFQGATAKNKALVAAFEQRLGKPIHVSKFCHLTGALGAALTLADQGITESAFKGLAIHSRPIPVRSEVCDICTNHCKITIAEIGDQKAAYGFLCGRDYDTRKFINNNSSGFDLLQARKKALPEIRSREPRSDITIGLPDALHMVDDLHFWKVFFSELGIRTVTSEPFADALKTGKRISGAEYCAPMLAMYGHVNRMMEQADYVFWPQYQERRSKHKNVRRHYCYYTQYSPALAASSVPSEERSRILSPLLYSTYNRFYDRVQIYQALHAIPDINIGFFEVTDALAKAADSLGRHQAALKEMYKAETADMDGIHIVLLGRPYSVLTRHMNKNIPGIFGSRGVKTFYQDMLDYSDEDVQAIRPLLNQVHWNYGAKILEAAEVTAKTPGAYPVFITSFKCSPDSFIVDYFKKVMEAHNKPYLVLQLDEHDSNVGYETRIEAAVRSFRNHHFSERAGSAPNYSRVPVPDTCRDIEGRTLFMPNWDDISQRLIVAALRRNGIDARLLEPSEKSMHEGLRKNTGQCIPLNIIAQEFIDNVNNLGIDPSNAALWMIASNMACNLGIFGHHIKNLLNEHGQGMERARVYHGLLSFLDISVRHPFNSYFAYMFGGLLHKLGCKLRPYEVTPGQTDQAIEKSLIILENTFSTGASKKEALANVLELFKDIEIRPGRRPKVAIFGDLYLRDNQTMNHNLVRDIEKAGGEVITTPYTYYMKMVAPSYMRKWFFEGNYFDVITSEALLFALNRIEKSYWRMIEPVLGEKQPDFNESPNKILSEYGVRVENSGESSDNLLKIFYLLREHPDLSLFVLTSPAFCCPSLVTEGMAHLIEEKTGVPVVCLTYDGTGASPNEAVIPYLTFPRKPAPGMMKAG